MAGGEEVVFWDGTADLSLAQWDGTAWLPVGTESGVRGDVYALAVSGTNLFASGGVDITNATGHIGACIAQWDGRVWSALGEGVEAGVFALAVQGTDLYVGGNFLHAGGRAANGIAKWDGSAWSALGSGVNYKPVALAISDTALYAGGWFYMAGGKPCPGVAKATLHLPVLANARKHPQGPFQFSFTYNAGGTFGVLAATNAAWPGSNWSTLGNMTEIYPGHYQFSDPDATNTPRRFYRVVAP